MTLYLKLNQPANHPEDYHLQAEVFKDKWAELKHCSFPWKIQLDPLKIIVFWSVKLLPKTTQTKVSLEEAKQWFSRVCQPLNELLQDNDYLVENRFTAADIVTGGVLLWALKLGMLTEESPVKTYITKLKECPALEKADVDVYAKL